MSSLGLCFLQRRGRTWDWLGTKISLLTLLAFSRPLERASWIVPALNCILIYISWHHGCFMHKCYSEFCLHKYFRTICQEDIWKNQYWSTDRKKKKRETNSSHNLFARNYSTHSISISAQAILHSSRHLWRWWQSRNQLSIVLLWWLKLLQFNSKGF